MAVRRTFRGRLIDMSRVLEEAGDTIAVTGSSVRMNARGDVLGRGGKVVVPVSMRENPEAVTARVVATGPGPMPRSEVDRAMDSAFRPPEEVQKMARKTDEEERAKAKAMADAAVEIAHETASRAAAESDDAGDATRAGKRRRARR